MSEESWKLEKFLCRCCLNEGAHKNLAVPFKTPEGAEEIYSEMLIESININLTPVPGPMCSSTYSICEECILRLRDAFSFKQQVLLSEKRFQDLYNNRNITQSNSSGLDVKVEVPSDNEDSVKLEMDEDNFRLSYDDDGGGGDTKSDGEQESIEERKPRGRKTKAKDKDGQKSRKRARKPKDDAATNEKKDVSVAASQACIVQTGFKRCVCKKCGTNMSHRHPTPLFVCEQCDYKTATKSVLLSHQRRVHDKEKNVVCALCDAKFFSGTALKNHMVKHDPVKKYACSYCQKMFPRPETVKRHEMIHTGLKKKVCLICDARFVQKASLSYHMKKYHPDESGSKK